MRTAVVVGAGVGGLAAAGGLARSGWQVTVLEQADRVRAERAALTLWPNGVSALHALGLGEGLAAIAIPQSGGGVRRPDGRWLVRPGPATPCGVLVVVNREDLHDALVAGLGDRVEIHTGVRVQSVHTSMGDRPAVGAGRSTIEADLVVAADGIDSPVRGRLAPRSAVVSAGCTAWRAFVPWYRAPRPPDDVPVAAETLGGGYRFAVAALPAPVSALGTARGGIYWVATVPGAPRPEPLATQLALLRRWFERWPAPIGELLLATDPADVTQEEVREVRPLPRAYGFPAGPGGVILLGDAAHGMPHHGQGACLALEDAATLASLARDATPGATLRAAVRAYDRVRRPRAATVVRQTRRVSAVLQSRGRLARRAREAALAAITPRLLSSAASTAARWRPPA